MAVRILWCLLQLARKWKWNHEVLGCVHGLRNVTQKRTKKVSVVIQVTAEDNLTDMLTDNSHKHCPLQLDLLTYRLRIDSKTFMTHVLIPSSRKLLLCTTICLWNIWNLAHHTVTNKSSPSIHNQYILRCLSSRNISPWKVHRCSYSSKPPAQTLQSTAYTCLLLLQKGLPHSMHSHNLI